MYPFVCKARINVADLFHHVNHLEKFTTAVGRKESLEHFVLKLIGYCGLSFREDIHWQANEIRHAPDIWLQDEYDNITVAVYCGSLELSALIRYAKLHDKLVLLVMEDEQWKLEVLDHIRHINNISVFEFKRGFVEQIVASLTQSLHWNMVLDNGKISISNQTQFFESEFSKLK